jgi:5-formyltetrahydrofolate cyclo-ligase
MSPRDPGIEAECVRTKDLGAWRKQLRAELLARREAVAPHDHLAWNEAITALLVEGFPMLEGSVIGCYWPFRGEFDPRFAIRHFRRSGARAALPQVVRKRAPLHFREWWPGVALDTSGVFGLPVPVGTDEVTPGALLIPPVGFDAHGYRLGYGGGYFDRTLAALSPQPLKIGVGFELSRIPTIRPQAHDVPMDYIVTQAGIHRVGPNGLELITGA